MLGGLAGAAAAVVVLLILTAILHLADVASVLPEAILIGLGIGAVLSSITTWAFLRRVPLWRASIETAFAATLVFGLSVVLTASVGVASLAGLIAALLAALRLKRAFRVKEPTLETA